MMADRESEEASPIRATFLMSVTRGSLRVLGRSVWPGSDFGLAGVRLRSGRGQTSVWPGSDFVFGFSSPSRNKEQSLTLRQEARERRIISNVKPFIETLRVTNPVRQSRASSRKRVLRGGRATVTAKRRQRDQTLCD